MTALRQRMLEDLHLRNYSPQTIACSLRCVATFAPHFHTPPDRLGPEHVRQYQLSLVQEKQASWSLVIQTVSALRFFSQTTLQQPWMIDYIPQPRRPKSLPTVLRLHEVAALLHAPRHLKSRAMLTTLYAAGLRVSELCHLQIPDVDSARMVLRLRQGKGHQDRYVMLSPRLLALLRPYWRHCTPRAWLFPGQPATHPLSRRTVANVCRHAAHIAHLTKVVSPHTLRHSFASHLLEAGVEIRRLQLL
jgi:site-specific recombinase XerD